MKTYEQLRGHPADFVVSYRLRNPDEGGRRGPTYQHLRCDFRYGDDDPQTVFMVHPEFLDEGGRPVPEGVEIPRSGRATMWIVNPKTRKDVHSHRISAGVTGYFVEGARPIADVVVEEVVGLHRNPMDG